MTDSSPRIHLLAIRADDEFTPCVDYVLRLFARSCRFVLHVHTPEQNISTATSGEPTVLLNYQLVDSAAQGVPLAGDVMIRRGPFFGVNYLKSADLPESSADLLAAAKVGGLNAFTDRAESSPPIVKLDLIAASFWFLSRYEELITTERDEHGRFSCSASKAPVEMYDVPVVNRWFEQLRDLLFESLKLPAPKRSPGSPQTIALTHDVDLLRKYRGGAGLKRALSATFGGKFSELKSYAAIASGSRRDPYDSFEDLANFKLRVGAPSTYFLQAGGKAPLDADYELSDPTIRLLISRGKPNGDEFALHGSYNSGTSAEMIKAEVVALGSRLGAMPQGNRQHYLRVNAPETLNHLAAANLRYDSSLGFADRAGFRCGWSGPFHPFDARARRELSIIEIPLICMDVTIANYEKIPAELSLERLASLLDASESSVGASGGAFVFLWHNIMADRTEFPGYWDTFEYFFSATTGSTRLVTMSALCDEFEASARSLEPAAVS